MAKRRQLRAFDLRHLEDVAELIGVDEAGRGALAGPVVAAAVLVTRDFLNGRWSEANARPHQRFQAAYGGGTRCPLGGF
jgi:ribonuclease HII